MQLDTVSERFAAEVVADLYGQEVGTIISMVEATVPKDLVKEQAVDSFEIDPATILVLIQVVLAAIKILNDCKKRPSTVELLDEVKTPSLFHRVATVLAVNKAVRLLETELPGEITAKDVALAMLRNVASYGDAKLLALVSEND